MKRHSYTPRGDPHPGAIPQGPRASHIRMNLAEIPKITAEEAAFIADERNETSPEYARIAEKQRRIANLIRWGALAASRDIDT